MWQLSNLSKGQQMQSPLTTRQLVASELWSLIHSSMNRAHEAVQLSASSKSSTLTRTSCQSTPSSTLNSQVPPAYRPEVKLLTVKTPQLAALHHPDGFKPGPVPAQDGAAAKVAPASSAVRR